MNFRVTELTEIALESLGYSMYDRNGATSDSLSRLVETDQPAAEESPPRAAKRKAQERCGGEARSDQNQFMVHFDILDVRTVLDNPTQYVEAQLESFLEQLEQRLMRTAPMVRCRRQAKEMREKNAKMHQKEVVSFCDTVRMECLQELRSTEVKFRSERPPRRKDSALEVRAKRRVRQSEQLDEFNMLLQLLQIIVDDLPEEWKQLDRLRKLIQSAYDSLLYLR